MRSNSCTHWPTASLPLHSCLQLERLAARDRRFAPVPGHSQSKQCWAKYDLSRSPPALRSSEKDPGVPTKLWNQTAADDRNWQGHQKCLKSSSPRTRLLKVLEKKKSRICLSHDPAC